MIDREGYRPNVGIVLCNEVNQVFWAKRFRENAWQFPQGGIKTNETPEQAMYRELLEETGLLPHHVSILGRTKDWLRYDIPSLRNRKVTRFQRYRGQKQIWFLLRFQGLAADIRLDVGQPQEFDDWRWCDYWEAHNLIVEFKKNVYQLALNELQDFLL